MSRRRPFNELTAFGKYRENRMHPHCHVCGYPIPDCHRLKARLYCSKKCLQKSWIDRKYKGIEHDAHMTARKGDYLQVPKRKVGRMS